MYEFRHWLADRLDGIGWRFHRLAAWFDDLADKALPPRKDDPDG